ncbi:transglutaminase family protein [Kaustia mangrovi]|uniref:Transglutaminase family protein n=1 Tax=Kaustia mangrovi TaxID=2593653 RepID=A0A7S8C0V2_9HYPH|nr:transglutaminase family protein [Kaustia mangrovi]QPC41314.1 transglutaminase family protein [Kaustia mangrovi]
MLITVRHRTRYRFDGSASHSVHSLRLTPQSFESQSVTGWRIAVPGIEGAASFVDGYGNTVHLVTVADPHDDLEIVAEGEVETEDAAGVVRGAREVAPARVYERVTALTEPDDRIRALAAGLEPDDPVERLHALMDRVADAMTFNVGVTEASTPGAEALAAGHGVCQDFAHVFISAARADGCPARYVTGYLLDRDSPNAEANHAWAEAHVDGLGWIGFDVVHRMCPTDIYVRLACGLDALDAAPVRGTRRGGHHDTLDVCVEVQQQTSQQ